MATPKQIKKFIDLTEDVSNEHLQDIYESGLLTRLLKCRNPKLVDIDAYEKALMSIKLLELAGIMSIPALAGSFDPREKFVVNTSNDAEVKISSMGENAKAWLSIDKIEELVAGFELCVQKLQKGSVDGPIIAERGGSLKARISRGQLWAILKEKQRKGEKDGWHIVYVEDEVRFPEDEPFVYLNEKGERSVLRAVNFDWHGGGWDLCANLVSDPLGWGAGIQILSSNSSETKS